MLSFPSLTSLCAEWGQKLYSLLSHKYGDANYADDPLDTVLNGFDGYIQHVLEYTEMADHYEDVFTYKWDINGGQIEFCWLCDHLTLTYRDTHNSERAKIHQEKFNAESI